MNISKKGTTDNDKIKYDISPLEHLTNTDTN